MKRTLPILLILTLMLSLCGCSQTSVSTDGEVTLVFIYGDKNIRTSLTPEETAKVLAILDDKPYDPLFSGIPSCGFTSNVSLRVDGRAYAIACDACNAIQDMGCLRYFEIPREDMAYIRDLFQKYGGSFPCI